MFSHDGDLTQQSCVLEVAVGDVSVGILGRDESFLYITRERVSPDVPLALVVVEDATHAHLGCVGSSQEAGPLGDYLG